MGSANSIYAFSPNELSRLRNVYTALDATFTEGQSQLPPPEISSNVGIDNDPNKWCCVRVFVSSTFADMYAEREYLVKVTFPQLRLWCEARKLRLVEVDLRWGVPADSNSEIILRSCLEEIDHCKQVNNGEPFFINMLGHRYGWAPSCSSFEVPETVQSQFRWVDGASVTTMELLCGALRAKNRNALCLIRGANVLPHIPEQFQSDFVDCSWFSKCALDGVKHAVRKKYKSTQQLLEYSAKVAGLTMSAGIPKVALAQLEEFSTRVYDHLTSCFSRQYPGREPAIFGPSLVDLSVEIGKYTSLDDLRYELNNQHENFSKILNELVLGRDEQLGHFMTWLNDVCSSEHTELEESSAETDAKKRLFMIVGAKGVGKSAMMACAEHAARQGHCVLFHSAQSDDSIEYANKLLTDSSNLLSLMIRICVELGDEDIQNSVLSVVSSESSDVYMLQSFVPILKTMFKARKFKIGISPAHPAVIFIDEVSLLDKSHISDHLLEVFLYPWPLEVRFVLGVDQSDKIFQAQVLQLSSAGSLMDEHCIVLRQLEADILGRIITKKFADYNKRLSAEQLNKILSNPGCKDLGWLSIACEEIRLFGAFETLTDHISELPPTIEGLVKKQLDRVVQTVGMIGGDEGSIFLYSRIRDALLLVVASRYGLRETELRELLKENIEMVFTDTTIDAGMITGRGEMSCAEWCVVYFWTKSFLRVAADKFGRGQTRLVCRNHTVKTVIKNYFEQAALCSPSMSTPGESYYRNKLASNFKVCADYARHREEYPYQLICLNDRSAILEFVKSKHFGFIDCIMKRQLIDKIRCKDMFMRANTSPELMCLGCSMKCTFSPQRLNRQACCVCGGITHSRFETIGATYTVVLNPQEQLAYKCRLHSKLPFRGPAAPKLEKCMVCSHMFERRLCFSPVICFHCNANSAVMTRCCHITTQS